MKTDHKSRVERIIRSGGPPRKQVSRPSGAWWVGWGGPPVQGTSMALGPKPSGPLRLTSSSKGNPPFPAGVPPTPPENRGRHIIDGVPPPRPPPFATPEAPPALFRFFFYGGAGRPEEALVLSCPFFCSIPLLPCRGVPRKRHLWETPHGEAPAAVAQPVGFSAFETALAGDLRCFGRREVSPESVFFVNAAFNKSPLGFEPHGVKGRFSPLEFPAPRPSNVFLFLATGRWAVPPPPPPLGAKRLPPRRRPIRKTLEMYCSLV